MCHGFLAVLQCRIHRRRGGRRGRRRRGRVLVPHQEIEGYNFKLLSLTQKDFSDCLDLGETRRALDFMFLISIEFLCLIIEL